MYFMDRFMVGDSAFADLTPKITPLPNTASPPIEIPSTITHQELRDILVEMKQLAIDMDIIQACMKQIQMADLCHSFKESRRQLTIAITESEKIRPELQGMLALVLQPRNVDMNEKFTRFCRAQQATILASIDPTNIALRQQVTEVFQRKLAPQCKGGKRVRKSRKVRKLKKKRRSCQKK